MGFGIVFQLVGLGMVLGISNIILKQVGKEDIANIANMIAVIIAIGLVIQPIHSALTDIMRVFNIMG